MATLHGKILRFTLLPGFIPRIKDLFTSSFANVAYMIAIVYQAVRLLPPDHPYGNPQNIGRYGIRHVVAEAANRLVISYKNADQVIIFFTILMGLVLLLTQFILLIIAIVAQQPAYAQMFIGNQALGISDIIGVDSIYNAGPDQDIAFIILDRVFGLTGIFGSCISDTGIQCIDMDGNPSNDPGGSYPFSFHLALHQMLRFYSLGMFVVSIIVILYFVITLTAETAATGSPFGQRANKAMFPLRLIAFFALLVPLNVGNADGGLNGAQIITFYAAKLGSNFATNAWNLFNESINETYMGRFDDLVAKPNTPEVNELVRTIFVAQACRIADQYQYGAYYGPPGIQAYIVRDNRTATVSPGPNAKLFETTDFDQALAFSEYGSIEIRFGVEDQNAFPKEKGYVSPICGSVKIPITALDTTGGGFSGAYSMQRLYYDMVNRIWKDTDMIRRAECINARLRNVDQKPNCPATSDYNFGVSAITRWQNFLDDNLPAKIDDEINEMQANDATIRARLAQAGWAGAAIWYNRIAQVNGEMTTAVINIPKVDQYPLLMQHIQSQNAAQNEESSAADPYNPALGNGIKVSYVDPKDAEIAPILHNAYKFWIKADLQSSQGTQTTGNAALDVINMIFGTEGIFTMRENPTIHPLAQLTALGKGMMDAAIRNMAVGVGGGTLSRMIEGWPGEITGAMSSFLLTMGQATIAMAFLLYYVLPFMPFIYFMFAVSGWVKSIFEAIVAMPLWALAHIVRIDGPGLPGPAASNGYFLILEIFLRPILILTGLLASISLFSASVLVLNDVFDLITSNLTGFDMQAEKKALGPTELAFYRGPLDRFFFTAIYVIMCYMMGQGLFKMVDMVPNNILRWMGVSTPTFSENAGNAAEEVGEKVYSGVLLTSGQIQGGGQLAALLGPGGGGRGAPPIKN